eukprot:764046-Hanusia_phi.AAC.6
MFLPSAPVPTPRVTCAVLPHPCVDCAFIRIGLVPRLSYPPFQGGLGVNMRDMQPESGTTGGRRMKRDGRWRGGRTFARRLVVEPVEEG